MANATAPSTTTRLGARVQPGVASFRGIKKIGEGLKKILYDRVVFSGVNTLASTTTNVFSSNTKTANPEKTNLLQAGQMGPNEMFRIQGIGLALNVNTTNAGLIKFMSEARLRIGVGPDDVERLSVPLIFLPTPAGIVLSSVSDMTSKTPAGFYRLADEQEIELAKGQPFTVKIYQGSGASAMVAGEIFDCFVQLFGTYYQQVIRG